MISAIETTAGKGNAPIFQLKIVLLGSEPPVWRRLNRYQKSPIRMKPVA